jgi:cytochrome c oxidase subunit 2
MTQIHVHVYERFWMWGAAGIIALFLGATTFATISQGRVPPSNVETIDPTTIFTDPRFATPGVFELEDGSFEVRAVAMMFAFIPNEIRVPVGRSVTFRLTSTDVTHAFQVVGTNVNTMIVPGYVSQLTTTFDTPGEYLAVCNEYCGQGHHVMSAKIIVEEDTP